ncbi:MAG: hypothetical protein H6779_00430 [Candidatus Nomurabacteria bacterium]|nr:MAG: hypothetical protein H6779_00430 [Candidatus Nomurabacteria bacterium]
MLIGTAVLLLVLLFARVISETGPLTKRVDIDAEFKTLTQVTDGMLIVGVKSLNVDDRSFDSKDTNKTNSQTIFAAYVRGVPEEVNLPIGTPVKLRFVEERGLKKMIYVYYEAWVEPSLITDMSR